MKREYSVSFFCYFPNTGDITKHYQTMPLRDIPKWIEAYQFTHPTVESITAKVWMDKEGNT